MKKWVVRIGVVVVAFIILALLAVFFSLDAIVKKGVETIGPKITKVDVHLGAAAISPLGGSGELTKFFVGNPPGYKAPSAIEVGDIKVSVSVGSVFSDTIVVNEVKVKDAVITMEGSLVGDNNLMTIQKNISGASAEQPKTTPAQTKAPPTSSSSKKFMVKDFVLEGAKVNLDVTLPGLGEKTMTVPLPTVHLQNIGTAEGGVTVEQMVQQISVPVLASVGTAAVSAVGGMAGDLKNLGKGGTQNIQKAAGGVLDMFNKK
jgi:hypothetical protein